MAGLFKLLLGYSIGNKRPGSDLRDRITSGQLRMCCTCSTVSEHGKYTDLTYTSRSSGHLN